MTPSPVRAPRPFGRVNHVGLWTLYQRELLRGFKSWQETICERALMAVLYLTVFTVAFDHIQGAPASLSVAAFVAPGLAIYAASERAFEASAFSILFDKLEGMMADILMAPLSAGERVFAYAAASTTTGVFTGVIVLVVGSLFSGTLPNDPVAAIAFMTLSALLHGLAGVATGLFSLRWDHYAAIYSFVILPISFLSGTFYAVSALPEAGQTIVRLNPVYYLIDGFRWAVTGFGEEQAGAGSIAALGLVMVMTVGLIRMFARGSRLKT